MSCFSTVMSSFVDQMQKLVPPCTENIINYFAFAPPPPSYSLEYDEASQKYKFDFLRKPSDLPRFFNVSRINEEMDFTFTTTKYYTEIACLYYIVDPNSKMTILYSHGNSCDLGDLIYLVIYLAKELKCNIFVYDYSGYGCSTGKPSEKQVYADVEAAALHLVHHYGLSFKDIILFGQSIGSAPSIDLASKVNVRGLIIQSGFTSALGVPFPKMKAKRWDQFRNIDKISSVKAPTLIIHGTEDNIVNFSHGLDLYNNSQNPVEPLWIEGGSHMDIESYDAFTDRLRSFLESQLRRVFHFHSCESHNPLVPNHSARHPFQQSHKTRCRHS